MKSKLRHNFLVHLLECITWIFICHGLAAFASCFFSLISELRTLRGKKRKEHISRERIVHYCAVKFEESSWIITAAIRLPRAYTHVYLPMLTFFVSRVSIFFSKTIYAAVYLNGTLLHLLNKYLMTTRRDALCLDFPSFVATLPLSCTQKRIKCSRSGEISHLNCVIVFLCVAAPRCHLAAFWQQRAARVFLWPPQSSFIVIQQGTRLICSARIFFTRAPADRQKMINKHLRLASWCAYCIEFCVCSQCVNLLTTENKKMRCTYAQVFFKHPKPHS
jgi:hypothetical protein